MVKKINESEFQALTANGTSVVDFSATWCGPCRMLAPVLEEISEEMQNVTFLNVDVDENMNLAAAYGITNIPALAILKDGVKQDLLVGFRPKAQLEEVLKSYL